MNVLLDYDIVGHEFSGNAFWRLDFHGSTNKPFELIIKSYNSTFETNVDLDLKIYD